MGSAGQCEAGLCGPMGEARWTSVKWGEAGWGGARLSASGVGRGKVGLGGASTVMSASQFVSVHMFLTSVFA